LFGFETTIAGYSSFHGVVVITMACQSDVQGSIPGMAGKKDHNVPG